MIATFIGHSKCQVPYDTVKKEVEKLINGGVVQFLNGGMGQFDFMCAKSVFELKLMYPEIKSLLVIPYLSFKCSFANLFDGSIYPEGFERYHYKAAIIKRNEYLVDNSDIALCYVYTLGRALKTYARARKRDLKLFHICQPPDLDDISL